MGNSPDDLKAALSKVAAITRQLAQREYPFDLGRLNTALQAIFEGRFEAVGWQFPSQIHAADLIPEGWKVMEDVTPSEFQVKHLEFISFLESGESYVGGEVMRQRAVALKANLGLVDAKRTLEHQDEIPAELRGKYLVFAGTVLRFSDGYLNVPCLRWSDGRWVLYFDWIDGGWGGHDRLARSK